MCSLAAWKKQASNVSGSNTHGILPYLIVNCVKICLWLIVAAEGPVEVCFSCAPCTFNEEVSCGRRAFYRFSDSQETSRLVLIHCLCQAIILLAFTCAVKLLNKRCLWEPYNIYPAMINMQQVEVGQGLICLP